MNSPDANVQLTGEQLSASRQIAAQISASVTELGKIVVEAMEGSSHRELDPNEVKFSFGATHGVHVFVYHGPEYCYVYDGDAGVCRPCTADEEDQ